MRLGSFFFFSLVCFFLFIPLYIYPPPRRLPVCRYMAPEVASNGAYDESIDVYSLSLVLWELASLERPYKVSTLPCCPPAAAQFRAIAPVAKCDEVIYTRV